MDATERVKAEALRTIGVYRLAADDSETHRVGALLRALLDAVERLEGERDTLKDDIEHGRCCDDYERLPECGHPRCVVSEVCELCNEISEITGRLESDLATARAERDAARFAHQAATDYNSKIRAERDTFADRILALEADLATRDRVGRAVMYETFRPTPSRLRELAGAGLPNAAMVGAAIGAFLRQTIGENRMPRDPFLAMVFTGLGGPSAVGDMDDDTRLRHIERNLPQWTTTALTRGWVMPDPDSPRLIAEAARAAEAARRGKLLTSAEQIPHEISADVLQRVLPVPLPALPAPNGPQRRTNAEVFAAPVESVSTMTDEQIAERKRKLAEQAQRLRESGA